MDRTIEANGWTIRIGSDEDGFCYWSVTDGSEWADGREKNWGKAEKAAKLALAGFLFN